MYRQHVFIDSFLNIFRFTTTYPTDRDLRIALGLVPRSPGGALDKALQMAKDLYEKEGRPDAEKIMVVIMDKKVELVQ